MEPENKANNVLRFIGRTKGPQEPWIVLEIVYEFGTSNTPVLFSSVVSTPQKDSVI